MNKLVAIAAAMVTATAAQAEVVNISSHYADNPVTFQDGLAGLMDTGETLHLAAGTYTITAVDTTFAGAAFTAANRFSNVSGDLSNGWEWNYWMSIDGGAGVKHGYGEGVPANGGSYQPTAAAAFAAAPGAYTFTLANASDVTLYWRDDNWGDNTGGISVNVSAVPEPAGAALLLAGLALLGANARRRRG